MPKGIPLTEEEQARRQREIFNAAVNLIFEKGFTETSMREIAKAAGTGKSTLYDYFKTKDDILVNYFEEEIRVLTTQALEINAREMSAQEKLREIMLVQLEYQLNNKSFYLKMIAEAQRLSQQSQLRLQTSRHAYQDLLRNLIEKGVEEGSFRPVDSMLAMRLILSAISQTVFTTRPSGTPQEMLDHVLDIILHGIQA